MVQSNFNHSEFCVHLNLEYSLTISRYKLIPGVNVVFESFGGCIFSNGTPEAYVVNISLAVYTVTQTMVMNKLGWNKPHKQLNAQMCHRVKCKTHRFFLKSKHICLFDVDQWIRMLCLGTCSISVHRGICNVISLQIVSMKLAYGLKTWLGRVSYWGASTTWNQKHQMPNITYLNKASERCCVSLLHLWN